MQRLSVKVYALFNVTSLLSCYFFLIESQKLIRVVSVDQAHNGWYEPNQRNELHRRFRNTQTTEAAAICNALGFYDGFSVMLSSKSPQLVYLIDDGDYKNINLHRYAIL